MNSGSGWNLWVWLLGVVVKRYIDFLILLIPTPLVFVLFLQQHPKCFSFLYIYIYITYRRTGFNCICKNIMIPGFEDKLRI